MEPALRAAVEAVHASPVRAVLHVTGGAAQSLGWVAAVPGASRTLLDARVPYGREATIEALGGTEPRRYVSSTTARDLAAAAYARGVRLSGLAAASAAANATRHVVGLGCTCALTSEIPKRGEHRCVVATHDARGVTEYSLTFEKGRRDRWGEDAVASRVVVRALLDAAAEASAEASASGDVDRRSSIDASTTTISAPDEVLAPFLNPPADVFAKTRERIDDHVDWLVSGAGDVLQLSMTARGDRRAQLAATARGVVPENLLILPGSFNPLHDGHRGMLAAAMKMKPDRAPAYELAVTNADKGTLPIEEVRRRVDALERALETEFAASASASAEDPPSSSSPPPPPLPSVVLTRAPLFNAKAALMPGSAFVVGHDTAIRLVMPKYYGGEDGMRRAFEELRRARCSFVVAGRVDGDAFRTLDDVDVPEWASDLFEALEGFRCDVSSTELRARAVKS